MISTEINDFIVDKYCEWFNSVDHNNKGTSSSSGNAVRRSQQDDKEQLDSLIARLSNEEHSNAHPRRALCSTAKLERLLNIVMNMISKDSSEQHRDKLITISMLLSMIVRERQFSNHMLVIFQHALQGGNDSKTLSPEKRLLRLCNARFLSEVISQPMIHKDHRLIGLWLEEIDELLKTIQQPTDGNHGSVSFGVALIELVQSMTHTVLPHHLEDVNIMNKGLHLIVAIMTTVLSFSVIKDIQVDGDIVKTAVSDCFNSVLHLLLKIIQIKDPHQCSACEGIFRFGDLPITDDSPLKDLSMTLICDVIQKVSKLLKEICPNHMSTHQEDKPEFAIVYLFALRIKQSIRKLQSNESEAQSTPVAATSSPMTGDELFQLTVTISSLLTLILTRSDFFEHRPYQYLQKVMKAFLAILSFYRTSIDHAWIVQVASSSLFAIWRVVQQKIDHEETNTLSALMVKDLTALGELLFTHWNLIQPTLSGAPASALTKVSFDIINKVSSLMSVCFVRLCEDKEGKLVMQFDFTHIVPIEPGTSVDTIDDDSSLQFISYLIHMMNILTLSGNEGSVALLGRLWQLLSNYAKLVIGVSEATDDDERQGMLRIHLTHELETHSQLIQRLCDIQLTIFAEVLACDTIEAIARILMLVGVDDNGNILLKGLELFVALLSVWTILVRQSSLHQLDESKRKELSSTLQSVITVCGSLYFSGCLMNLPYDNMISTLHQACNAAIQTLREPTLQEDWIVLGCCWLLLTNIATTRVHMKPKQELPENAFNFAKFIKEIILLPAMESDVESDIAPSSMLVLFFQSFIQCAQSNPDKLENWFMFLTHAILSDSLLPKNEPIPISDDELQRCDELDTRIGQYLISIADQWLPCFDNILKYLQTMPNEKSQQLTYKRLLSDFCRFVKVFDMPDLFVYIPDCSQSLINMLTVYRNNKDDLIPLTDVIWHLSISDGLHISLMKVPNLADILYDILHRCRENHRIVHNICGAIVNILWNSIELQNTFLSTPSPGETTSGHHTDTHPRDHILARLIKRHISESTKDSEEIEDGNIEDKKVIIEAICRVIFHMTCTWKAYKSFEGIVSDDFTITCIVRYDNIDSILRGVLDQLIKLLNSLTHHIDSDTIQMILWIIRDLIIRTIDKNINQWIHVSHELEKGIDKAIAYYEDVANQTVASETVVDSSETVENVDRVKEQAVTIITTGKELKTLFYKHCKRYVYEQLTDKMEQLQIPNTFICPITLKLMEDPVILSDGHSYEQSAIHKWLKSSSHNRSPKTNQPLTSRSYFPNQGLKVMIEEFVEQNRIHVNTEDYRKRQKVDEEAVEATSDKSQSVPSMIDLDLSNA